LNTKPDPPRASDTRVIGAPAAYLAIGPLVYQECAGVTSPTAAYAIAWLVGIGFVMIVYPDRVFVGERRALCARLLFGALTVGVLLVGIFVLRALSDKTGNAVIAFVITLALTTVLNSVRARMVSRGGEDGQES
jgi:hypothetical protein